MADTRHLGCRALGRAGSSPALRTRQAHAPEADVAHAGVHHLGPPRRRAVAPAVAVGTEERPALDDLPRDPELRLRRVVAVLLRASPGVPRDAAGGHVLPA